jgi:hypothetical protein
MFETNIPITPTRDPKGLIMFETNIPITPTQDPKGLIMFETNILRCLSAIMNHGSFKYLLA